MRSPVAEAGRRARRVGAQAEGVGEAEGTGGGGGTTFLQTDAATPATAAAPEAYKPHLSWKERQELRKRACLLQEQSSEGAAGALKKACMLQKQNHSRIPTRPPYTEKNEQRAEKQAKKTERQNDMRQEGMYDN